MLKLHRRKLITSLMTLQIVFAIIFVFSFVNLVNDRAILDIGLSSLAINGIVLVFSIFSMINVVYELTKVR